jgi:hypothetical protein
VLQPNVPPAAFLTVSTAHEENNGGIVDRFDVALKEILFECCWEIGCELIYVRWSVFGEGTDWCVTEWSDRD